jgi:vancomycin resistance protein YoaR
MRAEVGVRPGRKARSPRVGRGRLGTVRTHWRLALGAAVALLAALLATGVLFAGSPERIPAGVTLAGVNVGGLTAEEAERKLEARAARFAAVPVVFTAAGRRWSMTPRDLEVKVDWNAAVAAALDTGDGPVPLRGLERVRVRLFGADLELHADYFEAKLAYRVGLIAAAVDDPPREASIVLRRLAPIVVPSETGRQLDREAAARTVVAALAGFDRGTVALRVATDLPEVTAADLGPVAAQVRTALSAPIRFGFRDAHWPVRPAQLARFLVLPSGGTRELGVGGSAAAAYFRNLARGVARRPSSADFRVTASGRVRVVPDRPGRALDLEATEKSLLAAALSTTKREGELVVRDVPPRLTTERARSLRISRLLASFTTPYSGSYDRIRNLQLATEALDRTLIAPGATFSFNREVGPRTEERGYGPAPVIINGEYEDGIGGGVSQVATTVFNAAWEAGLKITARTPHALYISRYPLGRDATVNYPDVDLKFRNDTGRWMVMLARYDESGIVISLLGAPTNRRVVSEAGELVDVGKPGEKLEPDPELYVGERIVEDDGEPARAVTVTRTVYVGDNVLYNETWSTRYRSEPMLVRVGTKPRPESQKPKPQPTTSTSTTTTGTTPAGG